MFLLTPHQMLLVTPALMPLDMINLLTRKDKNLGKRTLMTSTTIDLICTIVRRIHQLISPVTLPPILLSILQPILPLTLLQMPLNMISLSILRDRNHLRLRHMISTTIDRISTMDRLIRLMELIRLSIKL